MKCVCPSGGDRTCPDDCLLAVWHKLPADDRKTRRKPIAEQLYQQGYTMEAIATQLGVTHKTVSNDLREFVPKVQIKPAKTASNPKGAGRPKGTKTEHRAPKRHYAEDKIIASADKGMTYAEIANSTGIGARQVRHVVEREQARREAVTDAPVDVSSLSMTAQEKLDVATRQRQRQLDRQFEQRVLDEAKRRIDEIILPHWKEQIAQAQKLYNNRKALMDKATFNKIRRALHPDSRNSISDKMLAEAFDAFMALEKFLLNEKDSPTTFGDLPDNLAEWDKMRRSRRQAGKPGTPMRR